MRKYTLYVLKDPETLEIKYVGITTKSLRERLSGHMKESKRYTHRYKCKWVNSLTERGLKPLIEHLEFCTEDNWEEREKFYIKDFKEKGYKLTNTDEGGRGICLKSRNNISKKKIVYKYDLEGNFLNEHESVTAAAKSVNCSVSSMHRVVKGERGSCKGFQWSYEKFETKERFINPQYYYINSYKVELTEHKLFSTQQSLIDELNITYDDIKRGLKTGAIIDGYIFKKSID
jgi:GIY-YIG catalytic domain/NUMOD1 domain